MSRFFQFLILKSKYIYLSVGIIVSTLYYLSLNISYGLILGLFFILPSFAVIFLFIEIMEFSQSYKSEEYNFICFKDETNLTIGLL